MILSLLLIACLWFAVHDLLARAHHRIDRIRLLWLKLPLCLALLVLTACTHSIPTRSLPVPAQCDSMCYAPCDTTRPAWTPADASKPAAWDDIAPQVVAPLGHQLDLCELHRQACTQCLQRLKDAGVLQ